MIGALNVSFLMGAQDFGSGLQWIDLGILTSIRVSNSQFLFTSNRQLGRKTGRMNWYGTKKI